MESKRKNSVNEKTNGDNIRIMGGVQVENDEKDEGKESDDHQAHAENTFRSFSDENAASTDVTDALGKKHSLELFNDDHEEASNHSSRSTQQRMEAVQNILLRPTVTLEPSWKETSSGTAVQKPPANSSSEPPANGDASPEVSTAKKSSSWPISSQQRPPRRPEQDRSPPVPSLKLQKRVLIPDDWDSRQSLPSLMSDVSQSSQPDMSGERQEPRPRCTPTWDDDNDFPTGLLTEDDDRPSDPQSMDPLLGSRARTTTTTNDNDEATTTKQAADLHDPSFLSSKKNPPDESMKQNEFPDDHDVVSKKEGMDDTIQGGIMITPSIVQQESETTTTVPNRNGNNTAENEQGGRSHNQQDAPADVDANGFPLSRPGAFAVEGRALGVAVEHRRQLQQSRRTNSLIRQMRASLFRMTQSRQNEEDAYMVEAHAVDEQEQATGEIDEAQIRERIIQDSVRADVVEPKNDTKRNICILLTIIVVILGIMLGVVFGMDRSDTVVEIQNITLSPSSMPSAVPSMAPTEDSITRCSRYTYVERGEDRVVWAEFNEILAHLRERGIVAVNETSHREAWELCSPQKKSVFHMAIQIADGVPGASNDLTTRYALGVFFFSMGGEDWYNNAGWLVSTDYCDGSWFGITCASYLLSSLELGVNGLAGTLPAEIGLLTSLETIRLYQNHISGEIPSQIGELLSISSLDLDDNYLSGPLPLEFGRLVRLEVLLLAHNYLTGTLPSELGLLRSLEELSVWDNYLNGTIPAEFEMLDELVELDLSENSLYGELPTTLGLMERLTKLYLESNSFGGSLADYIRDFPRLEVLWLHENIFTGTIPSTVDLLSNRLTSLSLHSNLLEGWVPTEMGSLLELEELDLSDNFLSGPVPSEIGQLTRLETLILGYNMLNGTIPVELASMPELRSLELEYNELDGLPSNWTGATSLESLLLSGNLLNTTIPRSLALDSSRLRRLELYHTAMTGTLPLELSNLGQLVILRVGSNLLSGPIPSDLPRQLVYLELRDNMFNSTIPSTIGTNRRLEIIDVSGNEGLIGTLPTEIADLGALSELHINGTGLSGVIPEELCSQVGAGLLNLTLDCAAFSCSCCDCGVLLLR